MGILKGLTDTQETAVALVEDTSDVEYWACLVDRLLPNYYWAIDPRKNHDKFTSAIAKALSQMFSKGGAAEDTEDGNSDYFEVIYANNINAIFGSFGADREIVFGLLMEIFLSFGYAWGVYFIVRRMAEYFKQDLISALRKHGHKSEEAVYHPNYAAMVRASSFRNSLIAIPIT